MQRPLKSQHSRFYVICCCQLPSCCRSREYFKSLPRLHPLVFWHDCRVPYDLLGRLVLLGESPWLPATIHRCLLCRNSDTALPTTISCVSGRYIPRERRFEPRIAATRRGIHVLTRGPSAPHNSRTNARPKTAVLVFRRAIAYGRLPKQKVFEGAFLETSGWLYT